MDKRISSIRASDLEYCPTLTEDGQAMLNFLREHPYAPVFRNQSGHRLTADEISAVHAFEKEVLSGSAGWKKGLIPDWLTGFLQQTFREVPFFRALGPAPARLTDLPTTSRVDLAADIAQFVPDTVSVRNLINFRTTGTTGHPLLIASHPQVAARYLAFHKRALQRCGIELRHSKGQVGVVLLGMQKKCFTYVSVTPLMNESGLAKINLHPNDWRDPMDREKYLDALAPEVLAGDPISFHELLTLDLAFKPRVIFSVGMMLSQGLRQQLDARFTCPVLDLYSMNEVGPIGVYDDALDGHVLLQNQLYIEILDQQGNPVLEGEHGEITFTGGFNFCLPLVRYRSGDHASLSWSDEGPVLHRLSGRRPVRFLTADGNWINNIDVSHALAQLPLPQFGLHQKTDGSFLLRLSVTAVSLADQAIALLRPLLSVHDIRVEVIETDDKFLQYTSDLDQ
jgi:phenylacetate-CoA ligase